MTSNTSTLSAFTSARICNKLTRIEFFRTRIDGEIACGPTSSFLKSRGNNPCYYYPMLIRQRYHCAEFHFLECLHSYTDVAMFIEFSAYMSEPARAKVGGGRGEGGGRDI